MKVYRCGYCGQPCDEEGTVLSLEQIKSVIDPDWNNVDLVHGACCVYEADYRRIVTQEMAIDAGIPEAEGMEY